MDCFFSPHTRHVLQITHGTLGSVPTFEALFASYYQNAMSVSLAVRTHPIVSIFLSLQAFIFTGHPFKAAKASSAVIYIYGITNSFYVWGAPSNQSSLVTHEKSIKKTSTILTASPDGTGFHINIFSFA